MQGASELPVCPFFLPLGLRLCKKSHEMCDVAEEAGSAAQQAAEIGGLKDSNAACHNSRPSIIAQSSTKHADMPHLLVQHAQLPQQEHGKVQQAQHAAQPTQHAQLPQQLQEQQYAQAQHALQTGCLSALFNIRKKKKSSNDNPVAVSQGAGVSGHPTQSATVPGHSPDTLPLSSSKQRAMQKLKVLAKKIRPSCMQACGTGTHSKEEQQENVQLQGLSSRQASIVEDASHHVQPVAPPVHVDSVDGKKQSLSGASCETPRLSRFRGIFRPQKTVAHSSKQASFDWGKGSGADSEQEPSASATAGSLIAAVRAPCDVEPQTDFRQESCSWWQASRSGQLRSMTLSAFTLTNSCKLYCPSYFHVLLRILPSLLIGLCTPALRLSSCCM